jgi:hypothetical protein
MSAVWIKTAGQIILPLLIEMSGNEEKNLLSFFMYVDSGFRLRPVDRVVFRGDRAGRGGVVIDVITVTQPDRPR